MSAVDETGVAPEGQMEEGEDEIMDPEENMEGGMDEDGDDAPVAEYKKKEFIAQPYESEFNTEEEVEKFKVKNTR